MKNFKIGGVPEHFNLPWRLAIEQGRLNDLDANLDKLNFHWSDMTGGTGQMIKGLQAGSIDIAVLLTEGITKAILDGLDAKILTVYVKSPLRWGIHVPFKSDIASPKDIKDKTFAISREGSGSHLMAYVNSFQNSWNTNDLKFEVVGDVYGGLWALENGQSDVFLWEKFTTYPFVKAEKCKCIGEVVTPWPCFVIAVRNDIYEQHENLLREVMKVVGGVANEIKNPVLHDFYSHEISWRYNLEKEQASTWLNEVEWNYTGDNDVNDYELVVDYLQKISLIEENKDWKSKLF
jgi:sulfonate transport system substrate-binding protein